MLNLMLLRDSRFWTLVEGMLDLFYTSMVMSMVFYGVVALSNPGYLPLHFPVQEEEKAANEDKQHRNGREGAEEREKKEEEQDDDDDDDNHNANEEEKQKQLQQEVLLREEGRDAVCQTEEKERKPRPRMASGAGDLDIIEEKDGHEEATDELAGEEEEKEENDEAELCAHLGEGASLTGSDEREARGEEDDLESDSESLLLELVEATSTPAISSATTRDGAGGGEDGETIRKWLRRRYCASCGVQRMPLRTHHCKECRRCVSRLDHHSLFVGNCIGKK